MEEVALLQAGKPLLSAKRISISYLLPMLLAKVVFVNELQIDGLKLHLNRQGDGRWNIAAVIPPVQKDAPAAGPIPVSVVLNRIRISDTTVTIREADDPSAVVRQFNDIRLVAGFDLKPGAPLSARVLDFSFSSRQPDFRLAGLRGRLGYQPQNRQLNIDDVRIRTDTSDITLNGNVVLSDPLPEFDLRAAIHTLSLAEVGKTLSVSQLVSGQLSGNLSVKGNPERFAPELKLALNGLSVSAAGQIDISQTGAIGANIRAKVRGLNPAALPLATLKMTRADINFDLTVKGTGLNRAKRTGRLILDLHPSTAAGHRLASGTLRVGIDGEQVSLSDSRLSTSMGSLFIRQATADLFAAQPWHAITVEAVISDLDPAGLSGRPEMAGKINLALNATASLPNLALDDHATAKASVRLQPSSIWGIELANGRLDAVLKKQQINIQDLTLATGIGQLRLSGAITPLAHSGRLQFDLDLPELKNTLPLIRRLAPDIASRHSDIDRLAGELNLSGRLNGWVNRPTLSARLNAGRLRFGAFSADTFQAEGQWNGEIAQVSATLDSKAKNLRLNNLLLSTAAIDVALTPQQVRAKARISHEKGATLTVAGKIDRWRETEKTVTLNELLLTPPTADAGGRNIEPLTNRRPIQFKTDGRTLTVVACELASGPASVSLNGAISANGELNSQLSLTNLEIPRITSFWIDPKTIQGALSADVRVTGSLTAPLVTAHLSVREGQAYDFPLTDLDLSVDYRAAQAVFSASGYFDKNKILDLNGKAGFLLSLQPFVVQLRPDPFEALLRLQGLKLSALPIPQIAGLDIDGGLDLSISVGGRLSAPAVTAELSLKNNQLALAAPAINYSISKLAATLAYADSMARFSAVVSDREETLLDINGRAGLTLSLRPFRFDPETDTLDLSVNAQNLKLSALPIPKRPGIEFDGMLNLNARAVGSIRHPVVTGRPVAERRISVPDRPRVEL